MLYFQKGHSPSRKILRREYTNQIGRGDPSSPSGPPRFEIVRPPEANHFVLEVIRSKSFRQSNAAREITYRARLRDPVDDVPLNFLLPYLHALFDTIIEEARRNYGDSVVMHMYISHPKLENTIIVPPTHLGYLTSELILEHIDNVLYSAGEIPADDSLEINAGVVEFLKGSGRKHLVDLDKDIKSKRSFVRIKYTDNSCLPRAIVLGYRHLLAYEQKDRESINH